MVQCSPLGFHGRPTTHRSERKLCYAGPPSAALAVTSLPSGDPQCVFALAAEDEPFAAHSSHDTEVRTKTFTGRFVEGSLTQLDCEPLGRLASSGRAAGMGLHRIDEEYWSAKSRSPLALPPGELPSGDFSTNVQGAFSVDEQSGDLVLRHHYSGKAEGVWGVSW